MRGLNYIIFGLLLVSSLSFISATTVYDNNAFVSVYSDKSAPVKDATFAIQVLKYEPYPVEAGQWFDLWVKVQNIGENDAKNAILELQPEYPFVSNDSLIRTYGIIDGKVSAFKVDQTYDATNVVLKYRVMVSENAPSGKSNLKLLVKADGNLSMGKVFDLPVEIFSPTSQQSQTDFSGETQKLSLNSLYLAISFVCGFFLMLIISLVLRKVKTGKKSA